LFGWLACGDKPPAGLDPLDGPAASAAAQLTLPGGGAKVQARARDN